MRVTKQRQAILRELMDREDHPTAEKVLEGVRGDLPQISLATVYRNLRRLADEGLVQELPDRGEGRRYDGTPIPHHHFFCTRCGGIEDVRAGLPSTLKESLAKEVHGEVRQLRLQLFGICQTCQNED